MGGRVVDNDKCHFVYFFSKKEEEKSDAYNTMSAEKDCKRIGAYIVAFLIMVPM